MLALPQFSTRIVVGGGSGCVAVVAWVLARSMRGFPNKPHRWLWRLVVRSTADMRRRDRTAAAWIGVGCWSMGVVVLHVAGLAFEIYPTVPWWDLLTHAASGSGVAALALLTHRSSVALSDAVWWVVPTVAAIGAGFEVYEFVFKRFWYQWSLQQYVVDTVVGLGMNTLGAAVAASIASGYRARADHLRPDSTAPNSAD